jgi:DNA polymerase-3 subunit epsilon
MNICFTGIGGHWSSGGRERLSEIAAQHGFTVKSGVSKKLDVLVAADPDSLSGKAKKARDYGIPIVSEADFWNVVGGKPEEFS